MTSIMFCVAVLQDFQNVSFDGAARPPARIRRDLFEASGEGGVSVMASSNERAIDNQARVRLLTITCKITVVKRNA